MPDTGFPGSPFDIRAMTLDTCIETALEKNPGLQVAPGGCRDGGAGRGRHCGVLALGRFHLSACLKRKER